MKIVLDAMGGDNAPEIEIEGALKSLEEDKDISIILTGKENLLKEIIGKENLEKYKERLEIINAEEIIHMSDSPAQAYKQKPNSSLVVAANLIKEEKGNALVSAGNTGAVVVTSLLTIGRIKGILRPAILTPIPSKKGYTALLDAGANVDCKPEHLMQFAIMGELYAKYILNVKEPIVGVLSIGEEDIKGNELIGNTQELLSKIDINFKGNVEGKDIMNGSVDVVVCDGFVGNVVLKFGEGVAEFIFSTLKEEIKKSNILTKMGALLLKNVFSDFKKRVSYDEYGGAPLLGIKRPVIITHGSANSKAIKNAIKVAKKFITFHINDMIEERIKKMEAK